jgi:glutathione S-transferase
MEIYASLNRAPFSSTWSINTIKNTNYGGLIPHVRSLLMSSADPGVQAEIMSWLFLQVTSLGPIVWQFLHLEHRPEMKDALPVFHSEILRILGLLEKRLSRPGTNGWISEYGFSVADICWAPLVDGWKQKRAQFTLKDFPAIEKWSDRVYGREAVKKAYDTCGLFFGTRPGYPQS